MNITACPKCGSTRIFQGTMGDGTITGITTRQVCRDCGYQGPPLIFESEQEYQKFRQELNADEQQTSEEGVPDEEKQPPEESEELTKEEKEIAALVEETEASPPPPPKGSYLRELLLAVILSCLFFIVIIGGRYFGVYTLISSDTDLMSVLLDLFGSFIGVLIFFFLLIVFIETLYRGVRFRKTTKK